MSSVYDKTVKSGNQVMTFSTPTAVHTHTPSVATSAEKTLQQTPGIDA